ncbi:MAG: hypothetical protein NT124_04145 [Candidatus Dependentiae bacterium]|nr:hypothetical protein [Candidatus Dependentiae bacterium]
MYFNRKLLYVYLFTASSQSLHLKQKYMDALADRKNIVFDSRESGNDHMNSILDDLYSMADFDCLIRPQSGFSKTAQLLGDHKLIIYPTEARWDDNLKEVIVDNVEFYIKDPGWCQNAKK